MHGLIEEIIEHNLSEWKSVRAARDTMTKAEFEAKMEEIGDRTDRVLSNMGHGAENAFFKKTVWKK